LKFLENKLDLFGLVRRAADCGSRSPSKGEEPANEMLQRFSTIYLCQITGFERRLDFFSLLFLVADLCLQGHDPGDWKAMGNLWKFDLG